MTRAASGPIGDRDEPGPVPGLVAAAGLGVLAALGSCGPPATDGGDGSQVGDTVSRPTIDQVLEARTPEWMELPGVEGTGIGRCDGTPCIKVFVRSATEELKAAIPDRVHGHPVRLEPTGGFEARDPPDAGGDDGA